MTISLLNSLMEKVKLELINEYKCSDCTSVIDNLKVIFKKCTIINSKLNYIFITDCRAPKRNKGSPERSRTACIIA